MRSLATRLQLRQRSVEDWRLCRNKTLEVEAIFGHALLLRAGVTTSACRSHHLLLRVEVVPSSSA
jgi:hypothetical protein